MNEEETAPRPVDAIQRPPAERAKHPQPPATPAPQAPHGTQADLFSIPASRKPLKPHEQQW